MSDWNFNRELIEEIRFMIDICLKYLVLFAFTGYLGMYLYFCFKAKEILPFPPAVLVLFTMVYQYFFRRAPKNGEAYKITNSDHQK